MQSFRETIPHNCPLLTERFSLFLLLHVKQIQLSAAVFGFCFQCGSICLKPFLKKKRFDFWIALSTFLCESWACFARGGAWVQEHNQTYLCSTWSKLHWGATCWNRNHAIFYICTAKKLERWAIWGISKARGCWNIEGSRHSFTTMLLKYKISIKSDRLEAKANNFVS